MKTGSWNDFVTAVARGNNPDIPIREIQTLAKTAEKLNTPLKTGSTARIVGTSLKRASRQAADLKEQADANLWLKQAFMDASQLGGGMPGAGGAPPMDPAMGGMPPGGAPPMDPAMMGMDPMAMGGMPPDPAMMGMPPDPAAMGAPPPPHIER